MENDTIRLVKRINGGLGMKEFQLSSADGLLLQGKHWTSKKPVKAVVQISHGMAEHIDRYDSFARYLTDAGIEVFGHSHRGHGKTAKSKDDLGYLAQSNGWDLLVDDISDITKMIKEEMPGIPLVLLGHSMGSFAVRNILRKKAKEYDGAVIIGSGWQSPAKVKTAQILSSLVDVITDEKSRSKFMDMVLFSGYNDNVKNSRTSFDWLTRDHEMVRDYIDDPYCGFICTSSFYHDLLTGVSRVMKTSGLDAIPNDMPILIASGDKDPVGNNGKGVKKLYEVYRQNGLENVEMKLYPEGRHEILNEMNRMIVFEDIRNWILERV